MNIDREIAEKIMGWKSYHSKYGEEWCEPDSEIPIVGIVTTLARDWHPSTDIAQAFQVVGKMRERGFYFFMQTNTDDISAHFEIYEPDQKAGSGDAYTPAEAICLAALDTIN